MDRPWLEPDPADCLEVDPGHLVQWQVCRQCEDPEDCSIVHDGPGPFWHVRIIPAGELLEGEQPVGIMDFHHQPDGTPCAAAVGFQNVEAPAHPAGKHELLQLDLLTVGGGSGSLLCLANGCGVHGWIRDGRWVPAG